MSGAVEDMNALIAEGAAANQTGDFESAAAAYRQALRLAPENSQAMFGLAAALRALGDYQEAERFYSRALAIDPAPAEPYWELGYTREMLGDNQGAAAAYEQCLARDAGHGVAQHLLDALTGTTTDAAPNDYVAALFDDYAEDFERSMTEDLHDRVPASMAGKLAAICGAPPPHFRRCLDLGAGTGLTGAAIAAFAGDMHGVDLSAEMLELAKESGVYSQTFVAGMTEFLAKPMAGAHQHYDLMISGDALVYVGDLATLFAGAHLRLNPGGWFLFTVELADAGDFTLQSTGRYAHGPEYLRKSAAAAGFEPGSLDPITPRRDADHDIHGLLGAFRRL
jgi:predicted TPR repeat methyltransferase